MKVVLSPEGMDSIFNGKVGEVVAIEDRDYRPVEVKFPWGVGPYAFSFDELEETPKLTREQEIMRSAFRDKPEPARPVEHDVVNSPKHYTSHPSGVECIQVTEHMNFNLGNAVKYIWRAGLKGSGKDIEDLNKARYYINREIQRREAMQ
ncbi:DUF3310 domain-containing protein [Kitasatospora sp. NPDC018623]|uniref:DUF3310 domain-containing protein n=1 Tax=Kitasatospora sp. NPDC018623 TaxID=3364029 RepID=UPI0037968958